LRAGWFRQAMELGEENLAEGLGLLQSLRFEGPWAPHPLRLFAVSPDDPISPPSDMPLDLRREMPAGSGHLPFLRHPEAFREVLLELVRPA